PASRGPSCRTPVASGNTGRSATRSQRRVTRASPSSDEERIMSRRELIDPEVRVPLDQLLEALPGGFNAIPDIVQRRATVEAMLAGLETPDNPNVGKED